MLGIWLRNRDREHALRQAFEERGASLVSLYRRGPYSIEALYTTPSDSGVPSYWTIKASVDRTRAWTQDELDDAVYRSLVRSLDEHIHGVEEVEAHG